MTTPLILASASPRRRQLLGRLGLAFDFEESHVDETIRGALPVTTLVRDIALRKARAVAGAYAIQGAGGTLVPAIEGRLDPVAGLPLDLVADLLGVDPRGVTPA